MPNVKVSILGDNSDLKRAEAESETVLGRFSDKAQATFDRVKVASAAAGVAVGALLTKGFDDALDISSANAKLKAQLGLNANESARLGKVAGQLYASNYGDSMSDVDDAIKSVVSSIDGMRGASSKSLSSITGDVINLSKTFDQDFGGVTAAVSQMLRTGLAKDGQQALDILTAGFQAGNDKAGDLLDTVNEYSTQFRKVGIDGQTAMGLISQGLKGGARDSDLVADAIKEFSIRAVDGSKTTQQGFAAIGLSAQKMSEQIGKGGPAAEKGLDTVLDRLRQIPDPVARAQAAVQLFGTQSEDLGNALFALDPSKASDAIGKVGGAAQRMGQTLSGTPAAQIQSFQRMVQGAFVSVIGGQVIPLMTKVGNVVVPFVTKLVGGVKGLVTEFQQGSTKATAIVGALGGLAAGAVAAKSIGLLSKAFTVLRASLLTNPLVLVAGALAALGAAFAVAYRNNDTFRAKVNAAWSSIRASVGPTFQTVKQDITTAFNAAVRVVGTAATAIAGWVSRNKQQIAADYGAVKQTITTVFGAIRSTIQTAVQFVSQWLAKNRTEIQQFGAAAKNAFSDVEAVVKVVFNTIVIPAFELFYSTAKRVFPGVVQIIQGAIDIVNGIIKVFVGVFTGDWGKAFDGLGDIAGGAMKVVGGEIRAATAPIREAAARVGGAVKDGISSGINGIKGLVTSAINGAIGAVKSAFGAAGGLAASIGNALRQWINDHTLFGDDINFGPVHAHIPALRGGGIVRRFAEGGRVPILAAGGELYVEGDRAMVVPGDPRSDSTPIMARPGAAVITASGQAMMAAGASIDQALLRQAPHFAAGGTVRGKVSTFGPPLEAAGETAYGKSSSQPGIAVNPHMGRTTWNDAAARALAGLVAVVTIAGHTARLPVIDKGPSIPGRAIDVTGAGARALGIDPAHFPTDSVGTAVFGGGSSKGGKTGAAKSTFTGSGVPATKGPAAKLPTDPYGQGYDAGSQGTSLGGFISSVITASLLPKKPDASNLAKTKVESTAGVAAPAHAPAEVKAMLSRASTIAGRRLPYKYGGGHTFSLRADGYDCSGYVSNVLGPKILRTPMAVRQPLQGALVPGNGKFVTVGIRGTSARNAHTMIKIGSSFWESGGQHGPARVPGWDGSFDYFHPRGYRRGGRIGGVQRFAAGGRVQKLISQISTANASQMKSLLRQLSAAISRDGVTQTELFAAQRAINAAMTRIRRGGVDGRQESRDLRGLKGGLDLVQGEQGRRIGTTVASVDTLTNQISDDADTLTLQQQADGLDADSVTAMQQQLKQQQDAKAALEAKRKKLQATLKTAKKTGNKKLVANTQAAIKSIDRSILQQSASITTSTDSIAAAAPTQADYDNAAIAQASLTTDLGDDRAAASAAVQHQQAAYAAALAGGDPRAIGDAATALKQASDNLQSIDDQIQALADAEKQKAVDWANADIAMAGLTDSLNDDVAAYQKKEKLDEDALLEAQKANDPQKIAQAASDVKADRDAIKQLNDTMTTNNELQQQQIDLQKQIADNQSKILAIAGQGDAILNAVVAAVSGGIGGKVGLGTQTPGYAGGLARY